MKIILAATEPKLADAWEKACGDIDGVRVHRGSIFEVECDALVSPANSYGFMDGGIDAHYSERFGWDLQTRLRRQIFDFHHGELLIGRAEVVETGNKFHPYLIAAPTMRVPMTLDKKTPNPYLATRAVLLLAKHDSFSNGTRTGQKVSEHIQSIAFPGMGTGVGKVSPDICARQMRAAIEEVLHGRFTMPSSWAEASERHQILYTDHPTRLQY